MKKNIAFVILFALFAAPALQASENPPKKVAKSKNVPNLIYGSALVGATLSLIFWSAKYYEYICSTPTYSSNAVIAMNQYVNNHINEKLIHCRLLIDMISITACTCGLIQTNKDERRTYF